MIEMDTKAKPDRHTWALQFRARNVFGSYEYLIPSDRRPKLFLTRSDARAYRDEHYGYIRQRPDLRKEPHGWFLPRPVKVKVELTQAD